MKAYKVLTSTKGLSHEEWLGYRMQGIGGSDAAAIVGLNPWSSPTAVFADKLGITPAKESSEAMRIGTDLEEYVAKRFTEATGKRVRRENNILQSIEHPFMLANVDRMIVGEKAGLECKTTSPYNKADWDGGTVPSPYYCQCQHYMGVLGFNKWYLAVLVLGTGFHWYEVERNEDDIAALIKAEEEFWHLVETKTAPEPDGSDASAAILRTMYDGSDGGEIMLTGLANDLKRYEEIQTMMRSLETEEAGIIQRIQSQMGNAHIGHADGWKATWKPSTSRRLDTKRIKSEQPDIYETYSKESTSRRFMLKKEAV